MKLIATPTSPLHAPVGAMLDVADLPDEYAVLVDAQPAPDGRVAVVLSYVGNLHATLLSPNEPLAVVTYASNTLETR